MMNIRSKIIAASATLLLASTAVAFAQNPGMKSPPFYPSMIQGTPQNQSFAFRHTANHAEFANRVQRPGNEQEADSVQDSHSMVQMGERNQNSPYSRG